jgi:soluble lytic murein transglycosylase
MSGAISIALRPQRPWGRWARQWLCGAAVLLALYGGLTVWYSRGPARRAATMRALEPMVQQVARRHGVEPALIKAVIRTESDFRPEIRGAAGEIGLMQITTGAADDWAKATGRQYGRAGALFEPELNLEVGVWYLARALRRWQGHPERDILALAQYNAGPSRASEWASQAPGKVVDYIPISSTRRYIDKVLRYRQSYAEPVR